MNLAARRWPSQPKEQPLIRMCIWICAKQVRKRSNNWARSCLKDLELASRHHLRLMPPPTLSNPSKASPNKRRHLLSLTPQKTSKKPSRTSSTKNKTEERLLSPTLRGGGDMDIFVSSVLLPCYIGGYKPI